MKSSFLARAAAAILALALPAAAGAQAWPAKPLKIIVPYSPGGTTDLLARLVGAELAKRLGQPVVVDNKPGANGMIGSDLVPPGFTAGVSPLGLQRNAAPVST